MSRDFKTIKADKNCKLCKGSGSLHKNNTDNIRYCDCALDQLSNEERQDWIENSLTILVLPSNS